jgi:hypothetical protein
VGLSVDSGLLFFFCDPNGRLWFALRHTLGRWQTQPRRIGSIAGSHGPDAGHLSKDALPNGLPSWPCPKLTVGQDCAQIFIVLEKAFHHVLRPRAIHADGCRLPALPTIV